MRKRNIIIAFAFVKSLYNKIIGFFYRVLHIVFIRFLAFIYHR